ncbi:hypothetical protein [Amnibacterium kyonggiense]
MARIAAPRTVAAVGGAAVGATGLLLLVRLLGETAPPVLVPLAAVALALGCGLLATRGGVVRSRTGAAALVVVGAGPLLSLWPVSDAVVGTALVWVVAAASVVAATAIVRGRRTRGAARWTFVAVAAEALLAAVMSTVPLGALPLVYLGWHLDLVRPVALLVWGVAVAVAAEVNRSGIRRRLRALDAAWRTSTTVGTVTPADRSARRRLSRGRGA